jgi:hypothetical protein
MSTRLRPGEETYDDDDVPERDGEPEEHVEHDEREQRRAARAGAREPEEREEERDADRAEHAVDHEQADDGPQRGRIGADERCDERRDPVHARAGAGAGAGDCGRCA